MVYRPETMWINDKNKFLLIKYPCCCRGISWEHCVRSLTYCLFVRFLLKISIQLEPQCRKQDVTRVSWRNIWWPKWRHDSWLKIARVPSTVTLWMVTTGETQTPVTLDIKQAKYAIFKPRRVEKLSIGNLRDTLYLNVIQGTRNIYK